MIGLSSPPALAQVLELSADSSPLALEGFLDRVSLLKRIPLHAISSTQLSHAESLSLFLNLYHTMVAHALLLLGPPSGGPSEPPLPPQKPFLPRPDLWRRALF